MSRVNQLMTSKVLTRREFRELVETLGSKAKVTEASGVYTIEDNEGLVTELKVVEDSVDVASLKSPKYNKVPTIVNFVHNLQVLKGTKEATFTLLATPTVSKEEGDVEITNDKLKIKFTADQEQVKFKLKNDVGSSEFVINLIWIDNKGNKITAQTEAPDYEDDDTGITTSIPATIKVKIGEAKDVTLTNHTDEELHLYFNSKRNKQNDLLSQKDNKVESGKLVLKVPSEAWLGDYLFVAVKNEKEHTVAVKLEKEV